MLKDVKIKMSEEILLKVLLTIIGIMVTGLLGKFTGLWKYLTGLVKKDMRKEIEEIKEEVEENTKNIDEIREAIEESRTGSITIKNSMLAGLRRDLLYDIEACQMKGYIPWYAYECMIKEYEQYHALGGNSVVDAMWKELDKLPRETYAGQFNDDCMFKKKKKK